MAKKSNGSAVKDKEEAQESQVMVLPSRQKVSRMEKLGQDRIDTAKMMVIENEDAYLGASTFALSIKEAERLVGELYDEHVKKAHELHKGLTSARKKLLDPLSEARKIVEGKMSAWSREQLRIAQVEAEKARVKEIKAAEKAGDKQLVKDLKEEEIEVALPVAKVSGVVQKTVIKFRITSELKVPRTFLCVDESKIKAHIAKFGITSQIEGVEIYEDVQTQIRG